MDEYLVAALARYSGEKNRGLAHTDSWRERMAALQQEFNEEMDAKYDAQRRALEVVALVPWWRRWMVRQGNRP